MEILLRDYLGNFGAGLAITGRLTAVSFVAAVVLGTLLALCRISPVRPLRAFGLAYVEVFRNVPLFSLLILVVYGLPELEVDIGYIPSVILAMTAVGAAFACEVVRTGINSIGADQVQAARSIGLTFAGIARHVVVPQAIRNTVQPIVSLFISILLSSSLAGVVGVMDLTAQVSYINNREALGLVTFLVAAALYAGIALGAGALGAAVEDRVRVKR
ncbi:amino acid ABC transporter permease [Georgenia sp. TF02-10]|uniref:amino acid ABC transporter permease n=1 Tax=Georgenia sp. TF02-10 TaxID=2917725 RepID=UPI001FA7A35C|nr:amino acid ABC transporter permease [Georgenia sp. TF02-10]UNX55301.1 amino acid ABC transporter permease [Georgenia sp. TF02-10]